MLFNSYEFLVFLPLCVAVFLTLSRRSGAGAGVAWLLVVSTIFYTWWNPADLLILASSVLVNFQFGRWVTRNPRKIILAIGVGLNLALLGYFKYTGFLMETLGVEPHSFAGLALPLGISFFTFQQIAYLVDCHRGEGSDASLGRYALFVSFFPQLIAGPIVHHKDLLPQFSASRQAHRNRGRDISIGLAIFAIGLFKKAALADRIAPHVNIYFDAFEAGDVPGFFVAWQALIGYGLQLYFDFSGYCDMALGAAKMLSIDLPINFASPYKAKNVSQFWRRWHITLSQFLRDYLYIPLGGSRGGAAVTLRNLMITMALGGLWHGAGWNFVFWGLLHGAFLCAHHLWSRLTDGDAGSPAWKSTIVYRWFAIGLTFASVCFSWAYFRAKTTTAANTIAAAALGVHGVEVPAGLHRLASARGIELDSLGIAASSDGATQFVTISLWIVTLLCLVWCAPNTREILCLDWKGAETFQSPDALVRTTDDEHSRIRHRWNWSMTSRWAVFTGVLLAVGVLALPEVSVFLYFQF